MNARIAPLAIAFVAAAIGCAGAGSASRSDRARRAIVAIAAGESHLCALRSDGSVSCVQVEGLALSPPSIDHPNGHDAVPAGAELPVPTDFVGLGSIAAGRDRTCGIRADRTVACVAHAPDTSSVAPADVHDAVAIGMGSMHLAIVRPDRVVEVFDLRDGLLAPQTRRTADGHLDAPEAAIDADLGSRFGCSTTDAGHAICWGQNWGGECGNGGDGLESQPVFVAPSVAESGPERARAWEGCDPVCEGRLEHVVAVTTRARTACALVDGRGVACWGESVEGSFLPADAHPSLSRIPVLLDGTAGATDVCLGRGSVCILRDGAVLCRGDVVGTDGFAPVAGLDDAEAIECTGHAVCARTRRGRVRCAGAAGAGSIDLR